jgi:hypothetical protein
MVVLRTTGFVSLLDINGDYNARIMGCQERAIPGAPEASKGC